MEQGSQFTATWGDSQYKLNGAAALIGIFLLLLVIAIGLVRLVEIAMCSTGNCVCGECRCAKCRARRTCVCEKADPASALPASSASAPTSPAAGQLPADQPPTAINMRMGFRSASDAFVGDGVVSSEMVMPLRGTPAAGEARALAALGAGSGYPGRDGAAQLSDADLTTIMQGN
jgi:hypothetical protein